MVRHSSDVGFQTHGNVGTTILALRRPIGSLGTRSRNTIHDTMVAACPTVMDWTPSPTPSPRSSLYGYGHDPRYVYPRSGSRLPSDMGKHISLSQPSPRNPSCSLRSCIVASSVSFSSALRNCESPSTKAWSSQPMDSYVGSNCTHCDRHSSWHHDMAEATIIESRKEDIRLTP